MVCAPLATAAAPVPEGLRVREGLRLSVFADQLLNPRGMALGPDDTVLVGTQNAGLVYALKDRDGDGVVDGRRIVADGLEGPTGIAVIGEDLYVADMSRILKYQGAAQWTSTNAQIEGEVIFDGFPKGEMHIWKTLKVGPEGKLYAAVGVPCNSCEVSHPLHGRLVRMNPDGSGLEILASGLRNSMGFDFDPNDASLWLSDNGRDWLGDDVPPDELNHLIQPGTDFGFPRCFGKSVLDPVFGRPGACEAAQAPEWEFPAHVAALGIHFYRGTRLPAAYQGQLLVAQHGSWNRSRPQGYRLVMIRFKGGQPVAEEPLIEGWLSDSGAVSGRPVDLLEQKDGSLLLSDDLGGILYRISPEPSKTVSDRAGEMDHGSR